jgi:hypothetical protein
MSSEPGAEPSRTLRTSHVAVEPGIKLNVPFSANFNRFWGRQG